MDKQQVTKNSINKKGIISFFDGFLNPYSLDLNYRKAKNKVSASNYIKKDSDAIRYDWEMVGADIQNSMNVILNEQ